MRHWLPIETPPSTPTAVLPGLIASLALPGYASTLLAQVREVLPACSLSVYRTGPGSRPERYLSASHARPDTTLRCWNGYLSGPWRGDVTLLSAVEAAHPQTPVLCHITAQEVPGEHRVKVYESQGRAERVSVVVRDSDCSVFAINFYRHAGQPPFRDAELAGFGQIAPSVLALTRKHLALTGIPLHGNPLAHRSHGLATRSRLASLHPRLTERELDVCERLLAGMTMDGIANDLDLTLGTVKTYRNRAFHRMGLHFRSELFALIRRAEGH
ncbi:helix-turn-helix transcriptional regulator [Ramlibacter rhizophilus]|uniref:LuxR family transcriptional regulator n=1 Tax=Ramlibacter rhizophilus TaxID=1781167 RepID=A0A4Z0BVV0_9BURK|nr:LuxR family transcriptional regulator [Ramlibacter rhizophilus]TFZ03446.1 LuxR family transcriptional regulator [Ramlibacter rhizophilus]